MANPEDKRAKALLRAHSIGGWTPGGSLIPLSAIISVTVFGPQIMDQARPVGLIQTGLLYAGAVILLVATLLLSGKAADAARDVLFRRAVSRGRIVVLTDACWQLIDHVLTLNDLRIYAVHAEMTYHDFVVLRRIAEDYQRGVVDASYAAHVIRPALWPVIGRLKAAQLEDQAKRMPLHQASAAAR